MREIVENDLLMLAAQIIKEHCNDQPSCVGCVFHEQDADTPKICYIAKDYPNKWEVDIYD